MLHGRAYLNDEEGIREKFAEHGIKIYRHASEWYFHIPESALPEHLADKITEFMVNKRIPRTPDRAEGRYELASARASLIVFGEGYTLEARGHTLEDVGEIITAITDGDIAPYASLQPNPK